MKRLFFFLVLTLSIVGQAAAQDVANEIIKLSKAIVDDQKQDLQTRRIAYFKVNVVNYMKMKVRDEVLRDTNDVKGFNDQIKMLNEQSYAMYQFVNLFVKRLSESTKNEAKEVVMMRFRNASINNPLFNDMDLDLVLSYYNNPEYLTRFSLDTDWVKALDEVRSKKWD